jgi:SagB-type dehydrogenase family enzyme
MANLDRQVARNYHQATKHSFWSVQSSRHYLDWENQPLQFKIYLEGEKIPLPVDLRVTGQPALEAIANSLLPEAVEIIPDLEQVAYLLYYSAGITKKLVYPQGEIAFRAAACAGALYPIEVYLACGELPGLPAGVYHFTPHDFSLTRLRSGDFRSFLSRLCDDGEEVGRAPLTFVYTAISWRSSWKYQARAYRYHFWDCGTILANNLAACSALRLPARLVMGFVDADLNRLIGIDGVEEKSLGLLSVGSSRAKPPPAPAMPSIDLPVQPLSRDKRSYPLIDQLHRESALQDTEEVRAWRRVDPPDEAEFDPSLEILTRLEAVDFESLGRGRSLEQAIVRRGSSRRFKLQTLPLAELVAMLQVATSGFIHDWPAPEAGLLNRIYLSVHAVDGLPPGKYRYWPAQATLELLEAGDFRNQAADLCLGQELGGTASATLFFLADLQSILGRYGNRGYRLAQLEAGLLGGKLYLGAYALGEGATGLTFYDDIVVDFFSLSAAGLEAIFVTALGVPAPPSRREGRLVYLGPGDYA